MVQRLTILIAFFFSFLSLTQLAFAADYHNYGQGTCAPNSICYTGNQSDLYPGKQCGSLTDWHYGYDAGNRSDVPKCWFGYCCDANPDNKGGPTPTLAPTPKEGAKLPPGCNPNSNNSGACTQVQTAIGTIPTDPSGLVQALFRIILSLSGGVATLLIIASGYQLMTSQGNPEKVKEARERLTAAIIGLIFIIFSLSILQIVGVDILHIPGLSR